MTHPITNLHIINSAGNIQVPLQTELRSKFPELDISISLPDNKGYCMELDDNKRVICYVLEIMSNGFTGPKEDFHPTMCKITEAVEEFSEPYCTGYRHCEHIEPFTLANDRVVYPPLRMVVTLEEAI